MAAGNRPKSFAEKLARVLASAERIASEKPAPAPAAEPEAPPVATAIAEARQVLDQVAELHGLLADRMAILEGACLVAGIVRGSLADVPYHLAAHARHYGAYMRTTPEAGKLVAALLARYREIGRAAETLDMQVERGHVDAVALADLKGKSLFMCKLPLYFARFGPLAQLFAASSPEPGMAQTRPLVARGATRPLAASKPALLAPTTAGTAPGRLAVLARARELAALLEAPMAIFRAVLEPTPDAVSRLGEANRGRAASLAAALVRDLPRRDELQEFAEAYVQLRALLDASTPATHDELQALVNTLVIMPEAFEGFGPVEALLPTPR